MTATNLPYRQEKPLSTTTIRRGHNLTPAQRRIAKRAFLKAYAKNGIITHALKAAGVGRLTYLRWLEKDQRFAELCEAAYARATDSFRQEIIRRGRDGRTKRKKVYENGKLVKEERTTETSDALLMFHAKAIMPEYREKATLETSGTIHVEVVTVPLPGTSDEGATVDGEYRALPEGST